jgi:hypothetical protein
MLVQDNCLFHAALNIYKLFIPALSNDSGDVLMKVCLSLHTLAVNSSRSLFAAEDELGKTSKWLAAERTGNLGRKDFERESGTDVVNGEHLTRGLTVATTLDSIGAEKVTCGGLPPFAWPTRWLRLAMPGLLQAGGEVEGLRWDNVNDGERVGGSGTGKDDIAVRGDNGEVSSRSEGDGEAGGGVPAVRDKVEGGGREGKSVAKGDLLNSIESLDIENDVSSIDSFNGWVTGEGSNGGEVGSVGGEMAAIDDVETVATRIEVLGWGEVLVVVYVNVGNGGGAVVPLHVGRRLRTGSCHRESGSGDGVAVGGTPFALGCGLHWRLAGGVVRSGESLPLPRRLLRFSRLFLRLRTLLLFILSSTISRHCPPWEQGPQPCRWYGTWAQVWSSLVTSSFTF